MSYPEPSIHDHNAVWNLDEDDDGNWICGCTMCQRIRKDEERDWDDINEKRER